MLKNISGGIAMGNDKFMVSALLLMLTACQSLPGFSRTGTVIEIPINEPLSSAAVGAHAGDEIRWTNKSTTPVRITFTDYVLDKLSCRHNFSGHFYSGAETVLQPDESAGLCFRKPATLRYTVRMDSASPNGDIVESGHLQIRASHMDGSPGHSTEGDDASGVREP
jgi:hypothetical protein